MTGDLQVGVGSLLVFERVNVSHQVTSHPERVDQFVDASGLIDVVCNVHIDVGRPMDGVVRNTQCRKNIDVEVVLPDEALMNLLEELARTGTLDYPVVVSAGECNGLADSEL